MPRLAHEPWCVDHDDSGGVGEVCRGETHLIGPHDEDLEDFPGSTVGTLAAERIDEEPLRIFFDYRMTEGMWIEPNVLRALHEALSESPQELREAVAAIVEELGDAIPPAHVSRPRVSV